MSKISLEVVESDKCPLYKVKDVFRLSGNAFTLPDYKPVCLILVKDVIDIQNERFTDETTKDKIVHSDVFHCSGCEGMVRIEYREEQTSQDSDCSGI